MIDGIIKADGTSRLLRADLPATYEEFRTQAAAGTQPLDVLFNSSGWSQLPTFLSKANLLKDLTAAQFGLGTGAVPDDVLSYLGQYAEHWWKIIYGAGYSYMKYSIALQDITSINYLYHNENTRTIFIAKTITQNDDGSAILNDPIEVTGYSYTISDIATTLSTIIANAPCYVASGATIPTSAMNLNSRSCFYIPSNADYATSTGESTKTIYNYNDGSAYHVGISSKATVKAQSLILKSEVVVVPPNDPVYVHSTDRNAYPDSGTVDDTIYEYLGVPFERFSTAPQIETGSYTGTGTYGSSNKNSLTFSFVPKLVFIRGPRAAPNAFCCFVYDSTNADMVYEGGSTSVSKTQIITWSDKTISWYSSSSALIQMNQSNKIYVYVAIG